MADGVKWGIDIDAKPDKIAAADGGLAKMEKHLAAIDGWTMKIAQHFEGLGAAGKKAGEHHKSMFAEIFKAELAKDLLEKLVEKTIELGAEALKAAANEQRMMRVFEAADGTREGGRLNEEWADLLAERTELTEQMSEGAFLDLKGVGASDGQAKLIMKAAADMAAVSKDRDGAFNATIGAFMAVERTGKIGPRALAGLGLGVKDFKTLDSMKGLSEKSIKERMAAGTVDKNELFRLVMSRANETKIGQRAADAGQDIGAKFKNLHELPERFFKKIADTKALDKLGKAIDVVLEKLNPDSPTGKKIVGFIETAFEGGATVIETIAHAIEGIDFDQIAGIIKESVVPALQSMAGWIKPTVDAVERILRGLGMIHEFAFGKKVTNASLDDFDRRQAAAKKRAAEDDEPSFLKKGKASGTGLAKGIDASAGLATAASFNMADDVAAAAAEALKVKSPSVVFEDIGAMTAAGFVEGIEGAKAGVDASVYRMLNLSGRGGQGGAGASAGGSPSIEINTTIYVDGGRDGREQGERAADAFNLRVRAEVLSLLEQMRTEAGA